MFGAARVAYLFLSAAVVLLPQSQDTAVGDILREGESALRQNHLAQAKTAFEAALKYNRRIAAAHADLGVIYMRRKEWALALQELRVAEELAPLVSGIKLNIGLTYYRSGSFRASIGPLRSVLRDQPNSAQARYLLGTVYFLTDTYKKALDTLKPLWPQEKDNLTFLYMIGIAAGNLHEPALQRKALLRLLQFGNGSAEVHFLLGKGLLAKQHDDKALTEFQKAAQLDPTLPYLHYYIGVAYRKKHNTKQATAAFVADIAIEPDVAYNYNQLGYIAWSLGKTVVSEKYFREALTHNSRLAAAHYGLAKVYKQEHKYKEALAEAEKAVKLDQHSASAHYLYGEILAEVQCPRSAMEQIRVATRMHASYRDMLIKKVSGDAVPDLGMGGAKE